MVELGGEAMTSQPWDVTERLDDVEEVTVLVEGVILTLFLKIVENEIGFTKTGVWDVLEGFLPARGGGIRGTHPL